MVDWKGWIGAGAIGADRPKGEMGTLQVKVCGITNEAGVEACLSLGVDHLGFNFVGSSKRFVAPATAKMLAARARGRCQLVGVFMDQRREDILEILREVPLDAVQLHGAESPAFCASMPIPVWKVFAVGLGWDASAVAGYGGVAARLYDTAAKTGGSGGTGKAFDWNLLPADPGHPWFLAGGLSPQNLGNAITLCRPDGIDLNSGVESAPGIKDPAKLRAAMDIVSVWKTQAVVVGLPGRPAPNVEVEGNLWPCWALGLERREPELESRGLLDLLEVHDRLVLDLRYCERSPTDLAHELIQWQMVARERGHRLKFRLSEPVLAALIRMSIAPVLEIVD